MVALAHHGIRVAGHAIHDWARAGRSELRRLASAEMGEAAVWFPVFFGAGIAVYFSLRVEPPTWLGPAAAICLGLLALVARGSPWRLAAGSGFAAALGLAAIQLHAAAMPAIEPLPTRATVVEGRVIATEALPTGLRLTLAGLTWEGRAEPLARTVRIRLRDADPHDVAPGDRIRVRALVRAPSAPAEPGAFDFQRAAYFAGQAGAGFALGPVEIIADPASQGADGVATWFAGLRSRVVGSTRAAVEGAPGAIATALLTGQQSGIPARDAQAMRDSGLAHLLSPSGLHVTIVMGTLFALLRFVLAWSEGALLRVPAKGLALVLGLAGGAFYMGVTGSEVPMQRSVLMAALVVVALALGRNPISMRAVSLAALVVLAISPAAILSPSFQMSFAAVAALVAGWAVLRPVSLSMLSRAGAWRRFLFFVLGLACTSALAGLATAPFAMFHFQRASVYGVLANALAVPLTSFFIMPAGIAAMLLMPLGGEALALVPMGWACAAILAIAHEVAGWPAAAPHFPAMPPWGLMLCTIGLLVLCLLRSWLRLIGVPLGLVGLLSPAAHIPPAVLVSADAGLVAVNHEGALHVFRSPGANSFPLETWQRRAGGLPLRTLACTEPYCIVGGVAIVPSGTAPPGLCGQVPLVVGRGPLPIRCGSTITIDRFDTARRGAHAVWISSDGPVATSDRIERGTRPWVPQRDGTNADGPLAPSH